MSNTKLFKSAISGYNKEEVMKYIQNMDIQFSDTKAVLEGEIRTLNKTIEDLNEKVAAYETLTREIESLTLEKDSLQQAISAQGEKISETQCLLEEANSANQVLEQRALRAESQSAALEEKCNNYEEQNKALRENLSEATLHLEQSLDMSEVEEILAQARAQASDLIARAKLVADKIISDAKEKAQYDAQKTVSESNQIVRENIDKVRYLTKRKNQLGEIFKDHKSKVDSFFDSISDTLKDGDK